MIRILYIEDDKDDSETVKGLLWMKFPDIELTIFQTGENGLSFLKQKISRKELLPCVIMLDLKLSDFDGKQLYGIMRNMTRLEKTPVAILTASEQPSDRYFFSSQPNVNFYSKPSTAKEYNLVLDEILNQC